MMDWNIIVPAFISVGGMCFVAWLTSRTKISKDEFDTMRSKIRELRDEITAIKAEYEVTKNKHQKLNFEFEECVKKQNIVTQQLFDEISRNNRNNNNK